MALSDIRWDGIEAVEKLCEILPEKIAGRKLAEAFKYALKPTEDAMKSGVNVGTGKLYHSIGIAIETGKDIREMKATVGPRRKKYTWNMQGWHAHLIEKGTKSHNIVSKKQQGMPMYKFKKLLGFAKKIEHPGFGGTEPFKKSIDATWQEVGNRASEKIGQILGDEIEAIKKQFGSVESK